MGEQVGVTMAVEIEEGFEEREKYSLDR